MPKFFFLTVEASEIPERFFMAATDRANNTFHSYNQCCALWIRYIPNNIKLSSLERSLNFFWISVWNKLQMTDGVF